MHAIVNIHTFEFYNWGSQGLEKRSDLWKMSQPINGRARYEPKFAELCSCTSSHSVTLHMLVHFVFAAIAGVAIFWLITMYLFYTFGMYYLIYSLNFLRWIWLLFLFEVEAQKG